MSKFPGAGRIPSIRGISSLSVDRFLESTADETTVQLSSAAAITWYCLAIAMFLSLSICLVWCWYNRYMSHRRVLLALQREQDMEAMSRIEANIKAFTTLADMKRRRWLKSALKDQLTTITKADSEFQRKTERTLEKGSECQEENLYNACSICLEDFAEGDTVAQSSNSLCRHSFHQDCIVSWLVLRQHSFCPCCRRPFLCLPTPQTSVASQEQPCSHVGDVESSRPDDSTMAPHDEAGLVDTLEVVWEEQHRDHFDAPDEASGSVTSDHPH
jgi:Ring finger domain